MGIPKWWKTYAPLCKIFGCRWENVLGSFKQVIPGALVWQRRCYRCHSEQDCSACLGIGFVDNSRKFLDDSLKHDEGK